jgi:hypothetical protein
VQRLIAIIAVFAASTGCHPRRTHYTAPSIDGLRFTAHAEVFADTLDLTVDAINRAGRRIVIEVDPCARLNTVSVKAIGAGKEWDSRIWELDRVKATYGTVQRRFEPVCAGGVLVAVLQPGARLPHRLKLPLKQIVGDSLSAGKYQIVAAVSLNGRTIRDLKAGEIYVLPPPNTR